MTKKRNMQRRKSQWDDMTQIAADMEFSPVVGQTAMTFEAPDGQWRAICSCGGMDGGILERACEATGCPVQLWLTRRAQERN